LKDIFNIYINGFADTNKLGNRVYSQISTKQQ